MNILETNKYIKGHGILLPNNQVILTKPLMAFKKIITYSSSYEPSITYNDSIKTITISDCVDDIIIYKNRLKRYTSFCKDVDAVDAVANIVIPIGARVNLAQTYSLKLRASQAYCYSIIRLHDKKEVKIGISRFNSTHYLPGKSVGLTTGDFRNLSIDIEDYTGDTMKSNLYKFCKYMPNSFTRTTKECSEGVHFFIQSQLAVDY
jgi:hypothetical protein